MDRTIQTTGEKPADVHVMGRLSVAYVSGSEKFLREFVEQPEVVSAVANQTSTSRVAAPTDDPTPRGANGQGNAEDVLGIPVPAPARRQGDRTADQSTDPADPGSERRSQVNR